MSSLPIPNAGISTLSELWTSFQDWQGNVSLDESITRMVDFTSMFFATSDGSFEAEELMYSMWTESIQMLSRLMALQKRDSITRSRMATLYAEVSDGLAGHHAEISMGRLILSGVGLRKQRLETSFGNWCTSMIQELQSLLFPHFRNTAIGNFNIMLPSMSHLPERSSLEETLMAEMIGCDNLVSDLWQVEFEGSH